jgi:hypothetical protein
MCLRPFDVFVSVKLQNRLEDVLLTLCFYEGRSEKQFTVCNFNISFTVCLSNNTANKVHKFGGHKYIGYLRSWTCIIPLGHFRGYNSATTGRASGILQCFRYNKRNKLAVSSLLLTSKFTREKKQLQNNKTQVNNT